MSTLSQFFSGGKSQFEKFLIGTGNWTVPANVTSVQALQPTPEAAGALPTRSVRPAAVA